MSSNHEAGPPTPRSCILRDDLRVRLVRRPALIAVAAPALLLAGALVEPASNTQPLPADPSPELATVLPAAGPPYQAAAVAGRRRACAGAPRNLGRRSERDGPAGRHARIRARPRARSRGRHPLRALARAPCRARRAARRGARAPRTARGLAPLRARRLERGHWRRGRRPRRPRAPARRLARLAARAARRRARGRAGARRGP